MEAWRWLTVEGSGKYPSTIYTPTYGFHYLKVTMASAPYVNYIHAHAHAMNTRNHMSTHTAHMYKKYSVVADMYHVIIDVHVHIIVYTKTHDTENTLTHTCKHTCMNM